MSDKIIISEEAINSTKLVNNFGKIFTRDQFIAFVRRNGLLDEKEHPTDKGILYGLELRRSGQGQWTVYSEKFQRSIIKHTVTIQQIEVPEKEKKETKKKKGTYFEIPLTLLEAIPEVPFSALPIPDEYLVLDTETTGLKEDDEVVELGIINQDGKEIYHSFFHNTKEMNEYARNVNNIEDELLENAPCIADEYDTIMDILAGKTVIGHNLTFDERLLRQSFERYGKSFSGFAEMIDSMILAKEHIASRKYSLEYLSNLLGIPGDEKHRATDDCRLTIHFLKNLEKFIQLGIIAKKTR